ncbi:MAG: DUF2849 domain-containing protein [Alphaproteobacteria bacterium]|jgi:sulfite reductase (NADPH) hemoprotein beta-component|nr:DUF2849 domain-containing protein [Alphaproteobacteria bacterium]
MRHALTANRLSDGEVVFWSGADWVGAFAEARLYDSEAEARAAEAKARGEVTRVIDPYLIEVAAMAGRDAPVSFRERIRALGPSNRPDHGKQAQGGEAVRALALAEGAARSSGRTALIRRK